MTRFLLTGFLFVLGLLLLTGESDEIWTTIAVKGTGLLILAVVSVLIRRWDTDNSKE